MAHVRDIPKETGLEPQCLEFELTQTAVMRDPDSTVAAKLPFDKAACQGPTAEH
jgi:EAL domain-containing protein (putative c-di-GMP-specific phosphodiesterase class I)